MSSYNNLDEIIRITKEVVYSCDKEIEKTSKETVSDEVKNTVYSYVPKHGTFRRGENGGMADQSNIETVSKRKGKGLEVEVDDKATGRKGFKALSEVTELGKGGNWNGTPPARPFLERSAKKLENKVQKIVKNNLKKAGFKVG